MPPSRMPPRVQEISNIQLPSKIKCSRCKTAKTPAFFSVKQLNDLKQEILTKRMRGQSFDAATALLVPCKACTSGNITELLCAGCDKVKGLDKFSKAQRRNPDNAKCWPCLDEQVNTEPVGAGDSDDDYSGTNSDSSGGHDSDSDDEYGTVTGTFSALSVTNGSSSGGVTLSSQGHGGYGNSGTGYNAFRSHMVSSSSGNSGAASPSVSSRSTSTVIVTSTPSSVNGDSNGTGKGKTTGLPPHLRKSIAPATSNNSPFAKVKAKPVKTTMDAAQRVRDEEAIAAAREVEEENAIDGVVVASDSDSDTD